MRRAPRLKVFHIAELDRIMALSEATRRLLRDGYGSARLRGCERILDPDSGEPVWRIIFQVGRRRKQSPKQTEAGALVTPLKAPGFMAAMVDGAIVASERRSAWMLATS